MKREFFLLILGIFTWYSFSYQLFISKVEDVGESPQLRARLGTILWHSSDKNGKTGGAVSDPNAVAHTYCYYPKGDTTYPNKSGEFIIKREDKADCSGWYGQAIFHEGSWVSEREKIWWNKDQKLEEELASKNNKQDKI